MDRAAADGDFVTSLHQCSRVVPANILVSEHRDFHVFLPIPERQANKICKTGCKTFWSRRAKYWSGRRESNPRMQLGKLPFCH
jgi:hypothetical protein